MSRQTPSERLLARLKAMGVPVEDDATIERTYAGYWMRARGAWVWSSGVRAVVTGSIYTVTDLVRRPRLCAVLSPDAPEWSVHPYDERDPQKASDTYLVEAERA